MNATYDYEETTRKIGEAVRTSTEASNAVKESIERVSNFVENTANYYFCKVFDPQARIFWTV